MTLPRLQLFEWNDLAWAPEPLRDGVVETLSHVLAWSGVLDALVPVLRDFLADSGATAALDCCAGAGGPARALCEALERRGDRRTRIIMSDLFPRPEAWAAAKSAHPERLDYIAEPVDATAIPPDISAGRARLIINALHHFPPPLARAIVADAIRARVPIFIAEGFERHPGNFLPIAPMGALAVLALPLLTPKARVAKALITWLSPTLLLAGTWDGLVSTMRVYTESELRGFVALATDYRWTYGTYRYRFGGRGYYFFGIPA